MALFRRFWAKEPRRKKMSWTKSASLLWSSSRWGRKAGNYLGSGIGIVFMVLRRRLLDGKPGISPQRGTSLAPSLSYCSEGTKLLFFHTLSIQHNVNADECVSAQYLGKPTTTGTIVNRTYGTDKKPYIHQFLLTLIGPVDYGPP